MNKIEAGQAYGDACRERRLAGIPACAGVAIGPVFRTVEAPAVVTRSRIYAEDIKAELARLDAAVLQSRKQLLKLRSRLSILPEASQDEIAPLLDAYLQMLGPSRLIRGVRTRVMDRLVSAETAVMEEANALAGQISAMQAEEGAGQDGAGPQRQADEVREIGRRLVRNLTRAPFRSFANMAQGSILVSEALRPADAALIDPSRIAGVATEEGGTDGHTAILLRALGVPSVLGAPGLLDGLRAGDPIVVDGSSGTLVLHPTPASLAAARRAVDAFARERQRLGRLRRLASVTLDGEAVDLQANLELPVELPMIAQSGAAGIGLLRSEFVFMNREAVPDEDEQAEVYQTVVTTMQGDPVTIRVLDWGGEKEIEALSTAGLVPDLMDANPALGLRGVRLLLRQPALLETQLAAILRAGAFGPVRVLLPMVTNLAEIRGGAGDLRDGGVAAAGTRADVAGNAAAGRDHGRDAGGGAGGGHAGAGGGLLRDRDQRFVHVYAGGGPGGDERGGVVRPAASLVAAAAAVHDRGGGAAPDPGFGLRRDGGQPDYDAVAAGAWLAELQHERLGGASGQAGGPGDDDRRVPAAGLAGDEAGGRGAVPGAGDGVRAGRVGGPSPRRRRPSRSELDQPGGEEPVHSALAGPEVRPGSEVAFGGAGLGRRRQLLAAERIGAKAEMIEGRDPGRALLVLERADGVDQPSAWPKHSGRGGQQPVLPGGELGQVARALQIRHVGVAADGPGRAAWGVEQDGVERFGRGPGGGVGLDDRGIELEPGKVVVQAAQAAGVAFNGEQLGRGLGRELRGLAAGGRAEIGDALSRPRGEELGGEGRGGVLHPERAAVEAWKLGHAGSWREPGGAGGEQDGAGRQGRIGAQREVQRGFVGVGFGDGAGVPAPACPEPGGRVEPGGVEVAQGRRALVGNPAQHGVHQAGERRELAAAGEVHGGADRRVGGRVEQQQGCGAEAEDVADHIRGGAVQERLQHGVERAEAAERGGGQAVGGGAVAAVVAGCRVERLVERAAAAEHGGEEIEGDLAGWVSGGLAGACGHGSASWRGSGGHARQTSVA